MGITHGLTNLGGSLLTAKVFFTNLNKTQKDYYRYFIYVFGNISNFDDFTF